MSTFQIARAPRLSDCLQDDAQSPPNDEKKLSSTTKIKEIVLERISLSASRSALLPTATAPRVLIDLLAPFSLSSENSRKNNQEFFSTVDSQKQKSGKTFLGKMIPIGLHRKNKFCFFENRIWINPFNALMQFVLFLPSFGDLFFFAPHSFHPFKDFIDQYKVDQQENKTVSSANTASLVRCAMRKLPLFLFQNKIDLYAILQHLIQALFPTLPSLLSSKVGSYFPDSLAFHPEWHLVWDVKKGKTLDEIIQQKWNEKAQEVLVSVKGVEGSFCNLIKKQFFTPSDWFCYDLDAFIEMRPDHGGVNFVTYLKLDGGWYQCDDEKVVRLRSNSLNVPLCRSILLHYKRIEFGRPGWG